MSINQDIKYKLGFIGEKIVRERVIFFFEKKKQKALISYRAIDVKFVLTPQTSRKFPPRVLLGDKSKQ